MSSGNDMEVPSNAPEHCPGVGSETAGKASSCEGCPNQSLCSSGVSKSFTEGVEKVSKRLSSVKNKIAILSGKGGVGKSTFTALLSRHLASLHQPNYNVGVVDIDICGPSMPRLMGLENEDVHMSGSGWCPVYVEENLAVMSVGFLLKDPDEAIVWRGNRKTNMIQDLLGEVDWGNEEVDFLLLDTPPGTSDEHISTVGLLKGLGLSAVIVTTPQEVALLDVRKEIDFCRKVNINIIGVVENMSPFICPKCQGESDIFNADTGGVVKMCSDLNVRFLGKMPLDPKLTRSCDEGTDLSDFDKQHPAIIALTQIANNIIDAVSEKV